MLKHAYIIALLLVSGICFAQTDNNTNNNLDEETVIVVSPYKPQLANAKQIDINPSAGDIPNYDSNQNNGNQQQGLNYNIDPKFLTLELEAPQIKPVSLRKKEEADKVYHFWLKAGFGNNLTPLVSLSTNSGNKFNKVLVGADASHLSSNAGDARAFQQNRGKFFTLIKNDKLAFDINANYDFNRYHYYAFNNLADSTLHAPADELRIKSHKGGLGFSLNNLHKAKASVEYNTNFDFSLFKNNYQITETTSLFDAAFYKVWDKGAAIGTDFDLGLTVHSDSLSADTSSYKNFTLGLTPQFKYNRPWGRFALGFWMGIDRGNFYPFPYLYAEVDAVPKIFSIYAGLEKKIKRNTYASLSEENPFLEAVIPFENTISQSIYGGFKIGLGKHLALNLKGFWNTDKNQALFVVLDDYITDSNFVNRRYTTVYENKLQRFGGTIEAAVYMTRKSELSAVVTYQHFKLQEQAEAWHLPRLKTQIKYELRPIEKLSLEADFILLSLAKAFDMDTGESVKLKPVVDLNASAKFHINKHLALFLNVNNLALVKYQRYLYYDNYRLNLVGGITARF